MTETDAATARLLDRFLTELRALAPVAVWAHGSLAGGDYQEGRSDLDLIAVLEDPVPSGTVRELVRLHRRLRVDEPLAVKLHCSYLTPAGSVRLISKREALDLLPELGAPLDVVEDIRRRRYGDPAPHTDEWPARRAELTRGYLGPAIDGLVATYEGFTRA
ncbi:nucleotidyltransferase domain-containing protein [Streptomyces sp. NPDC005808]|uniref:nucleotidyltransferase domain-containing protein n=1 Tax=Streptomyces sp. NPDC005808 TaxID=3364734 RepID=UPI0036B331DB